MPTVKTKRFLINIDGSNLNGLKLIAEFKKLESQNEKLQKKLDDMEPTFKQAKKDAKELIRLKKKSYEFQYSTWGQKVFRETGGSLGHLAEVIEKFDKKGVKEIIALLNKYEETYGKRLKPKKRKK